MDSDEQLVAEMENLTRQIEAMLPSAALLLQRVRPTWDRLVTQTEELGKQYRALRSAGLMPEPESPVFEPLVARIESLSRRFRAAATTDLTPASVWPSIKECVTEIERLRRVYLRRKASGSSAQTRSRADWLLHYTRTHVENVYIRFGSGGLALLLIEYETERDQLRRYAAARAGRPVGEWGRDRWQSVAQWESWKAGPQLPQATGTIRRWARQLLAQGLGYEHALRVMADLVMMRHPDLAADHRYGGIGGGEERARSFALIELTPREAKSVKQTLDVEFRQQRQQDPPPLPRRWWRFPDGKADLGWLPREMLNESLREGLPPIVPSEVVDGLLLKMGARWEGPFLVTV